MKGIEILTALIAIIVAYIAYRQWKTADERLKLDLFDRRYEIYCALGDHFGRIKGSGKVADGQAGEFIVEMQLARWIFDDEIHRYLMKRVLDRMHQLKLLEDELSQTSREDGSRRKNLEDQRNIKDQLVRDRENLDKMFKPYLAFGKRHFS